MRRRELLGGALGLALGCGRSQPREVGEASPSPKPRISRVRVLTYNVLADEVALERRIPALMRVMHEAQPDVLALQEVAPWFMDWIADTPWLAEYELASIDGQPARPNGQLIASRWPTRATRFYPLPGAQGRTVLVTEVELEPGDRICVATTHMESYLEDGAIRADQLDRIFAEIAGAGRDPAVRATVVCGDLNFGEGEQPDTAHLDPAFVDAWSALHPGEPGSTWDIERSEMARRGSFVGEPSRRLDRVLLRSEAWRPSSIRIVGDEPVTPGDRSLFPSDHFGLLAELERVRPAPARAGP